MSLFTKIQRFTAGGFGLAAIFLLLPFLTISCDNQKIITLGGIDLLIGVEVKTIRELDEKTFINLEKLLMRTPDNEVERAGFDVKDAIKPVPADPSDHSPANRYAIILMVTCLLGIGIILLNDYTTSQYIGTLLSLIALIATLLTPQQFTQLASATYLTGALVVKREIGFYLVLLCLCCTLGMNLFALFRDQFMYEDAELI
ncbi:hypothetical protein GCM10028808_25990 [Spirosoma migulaei]